MGKHRAALKECVGVYQDDKEWGNQKEQKCEDLKVRENMKT